MKHVILATAAAVLLLSIASASELGTKIAMGPTSAAHFPTNQPRGTSSPSCTLPDNECPPGHKALGHMYKAHKPPHRKHSQD